jgi:tetratricopeptide (TPR) repeat protein
MVSELLNYLHTRPILVFNERIKVETQKGKSKSATLQKVEIRDHERRFFLVPEKLAAKNNINFLNIRDDYYVIVPPDTDLSFSDARRAFLRFVIDPLVLNNSKEIAPMGDWAKPILAELRKTDPQVSPDVLLTLSRSLVAAVDTRQLEFMQGRIATEQARARLASLKTDAEKRAVTADLEKFKQALADESAQRLYEDYQKGAVFALYFAEQLKGVEDSGFDIASSLREMIAAFDAAKENGRIAGTAEARKRALAAREQRKQHPEPLTFVTENPVTVRLIEIQKLIDAKNYEKAGADLKLLAEQNPTEPRIHFNIGRVASLTAAGIADEDLQAKRLTEAKTAYTNVIKNSTPATDKALLSLTFVALGRIYEFFNDPEYAAKLYDEAIKLGDVTGGGQKDAIAAKQRLLKPE